MYSLLLQERISGAVTVVGRDLEGLLRNRNMSSGLRTTAENLQVLLFALSQTLHNTFFRDLPGHIRQQLIRPMLSAAHSCTENFYQQLGVTPNIIEALQPALSGVPPSSGVILHDQQQTPRQANQTNDLPQPDLIQVNEIPPPPPPTSSGVIQHDQQQIPRQRREANQISALPQPDPRQVNENPPPPPADDITWLDHLRHVVQFCGRNWKWIALGAVVGIAVGGKP